MKPNVENDIDINKLSTKEIFNLIEKLNKTYTVVKGWGLIKDNSIESFDETSYIIECGNGEDCELIEDFFNDFEYELEDGFYEFRFLISYSPAQIGNYPPPNVECEAYYDYCDSIFEMKATIEEYTNENF